VREFRTPGFRGGAGWRLPVSTPTVQNKVTDAKRKFRFLGNTKMVKYFEFWLVKDIFQKK
jgi:hypothetical protein